VQLPALACTCKSWQEAEQHCSARSLHVQLQGKAARSLKLCSFASWLPKHAALVNSIAIGNVTPDEYVRFVGAQPPAAEVSAAEELRQALQLAALRPALGDTHVAPSSAANQLASSAQQGALRLASLSSDLPGAAGLLAALPAHSLTRLELGLERSGSSGSSSALSAALAQLSNLQQLHISGGHDSHGSCLAGITQLSCLTSLRLAGCWDIGEHLQELLAQPLPLRVLNLRLSSSLPDLNLAVLTQLEEVNTVAGMTDSMHGPWVFPDQVRQLDLGVLNCAGMLAAVTGLQQLRRLKFEAISWQEEDVLLLPALAQLPALQHVETTFDDAACAVEAIAALPQLPQLRVLTVVFHWHNPDYEDWEQIKAAVAACTGLTRLRMDTGAVENPLPAGENK
jgi:hypothetical protein